MHVTHVWARKWDDVTTYAVLIWSSCYYALEIASDECHFKFTLFVGRKAYHKPVGKAAGTLDANLTCRGSARLAYGAFGTKRRKGPEFAAALRAFPISAR